MARELDLTNNQYRMLLHQCDALAQAGARDFGNPGDWPQDELETSITATGIFTAGPTPC